VLAAPRYPNLLLRFILLAASGMIGKGADRTASISISSAFRVGNWIGGLVRAMTHAVAAAARHAARLLAQGPARTLAVSRS
jgi:hypothetical protein